ncbi:ASKHA domain-containing protein [Aliamphritea spongicola]|nr:ASKHA domain-containing protein [Aliamphritea spongicola]
MHPQARAFVLPCIAGHIGADTAGVILAERPDLVDDVTLLVDVGTNAEIVLGNKDRLLAASSPTGPAFEGAQISCGQRAASGAIERVRIDPETLEPRFRVIGSELWSDEEGFAESVAKTGVTGICGSGIIEVIAEMFLAGILDVNGVVDPAMAEKSPRIIAEGRTYSYVLFEGEKTLAITQNDVRAIQLAKAALYAGIRLLMDHFGVKTVDKIGLAGAFGSHIDVKYAMILGLIPDCDLENVGPIGNAAGTGARIALLDRFKRDEIERVLRRVEKIETALEAKFQDHFVAAMALPHGSDDFAELSKAVNLPERKVVDTQAAGGGRSRGRRRARPRPAAEAE